MKGINKVTYKAIAVGASSGGLNAISVLLKALPENYNIPIIIVQHLSPQSDNFWINNLNDVCKLEVREAEEKEQVQTGFVYLAPPNYHLLIEPDGTLALSVEEKVNFSRPSIDVLFEAAADVYKEDLIGILLTGSSKDGASGMKKIKEKGGITIVQDPNTAESRSMPEAAIKVSKIDHILPLEGIIELLIKLNSN